MTLLTPNFAEHKTNGAAGPVHVIAAHEPTREGEQQQPQQPVGAAAGAAHNPTPAAAAGPLKVALIGTAPSSRMLAPFNDPTWQIWGCSPGNMNTLPRVDLWFELHSNLLWPEHESYGRPYIEWLKQQTFPVYMQDNSLVPRAMAFPKDEMVAEFGDDFFTSSFSWMMALAMKMGAREIALYGIDMASRDEYVQQRPGFYFFRYVAALRGIKVTAPHESDIMQSPPLYAYVDSTPFGRKIMARRQEVGGRINGMTAERDKLNHNITYLQGALEDLDYFSSIWSGVSNDMGKLMHQNAQLQQANLQLQMQVAQFAASLPRPGTADCDVNPVAMRVGLADSDVNALNPVAVEAARKRRRRKPLSVPDIIVMDDPHQESQGG
jgi:hypothetical protein